MASSTPRTSRDDEYNNNSGDNNGGHRTTRETGKTFKVDDDDVAPSGDKPLNLEMHGKRTTLSRSSGHTDDESGESRDLWNFHELSANADHAVDYASFQ